MVTVAVEAVETLPATLDIELLAGSLHEITAQATDAAGNVSDVSAVLAITVDTAATTITVKTVGTIEPNSNLVATFSEAKWLNHLFPW
jgi:hypothetical protein